MLFTTSGLSVLALAASVNAGVVSSGPSYGKPHRSNAGRKRGSLAARDVQNDIWCGAVTTSKNITSVEASWTVPTASIPKGGSKDTDYWFYQWVGFPLVNMVGSAR